MKKFIAIALLVAAAKLGYSQGTVNFNTAVGATTTVRYEPGTPLGGAAGLKIDGSAHPTAQAAIYAGAAGSTEAQLVMITPAAGFASGATAGYITAGSRTISFLPQGYQNAVVQIRAWDGLTATYSSYEQAITHDEAYRGKSPLYTITAALGGPGSSDGSVPQATAANIPGQVGFTIAPVPEPSAIALGLIGLSSVWMLRRKK